MFFVKPKVGKNVVCSRFVEDMVDGTKRNILFCVLQLSPAPVAPRSSNVFWTANLKM